MDSHNFRFKIDGNRLYWSALGNYDDWKIDPLCTQCSYAEFGDCDGDISNVRPYSAGIMVFKAGGAAYYGRYVGVVYPLSPIWEFVRVDGDRGIGFFPVPQFAGRFDDKGMALLWEWPTQ